jgi:hypothetical protein
MPVLETLRDWWANLKAEPDHALAYNLAGLGVRVAALVTAIVIVECTGDCLLQYLPVIPPPSTN